MQIDGCFVNMFERLIDMLISRVAPPAGAGVILFTAQVGAGGAQQFHHPAEAFPAFQTQIGMRMVVNVFAIDYRGAIDFADGGLYFMIGFHHMARHIELLADAQQKLSGAQVAAGARCGAASESF